MMRPAFYAVLMLLFTMSFGDAKPSRDDIVAYAKDCTAKNVDIDLVAKFGTDYRNLDLHAIDLRGASVNHKTIWRKADLSGADLAGAILTGVDLADAKLEGCCLTDAYLSGARLTGANLAGANLRAAKLDFTNFDRANLGDADLTGAEVSATRFIDANLRRAKLRGLHCPWYPPQFSGSDLTDADLKDAALLPGAEFQRTIMHRVDVQNATLVRADFTGADLKGTRLDDADFKYAILEDVRGLEPPDVTRLRTKAARWEYDLEEQGRSAWRLVHTALFWIAPALGFWFGLVVRRRTEPSFRRFLGSVAVTTNLLILVGPLSVFTLSFFGSNIAQYNAGSPHGFSAWSFWFSYFPILMLGLVAAVATSSIFAVVCSVWAMVSFRAWWRLAICWAATLVHAIVEFQFVGQFFPDA